MSSWELVDAATARDARGLRLVVAKGVPSPWSLAALAIVQLKQLPALVVRAIGRDEAVAEWTGIRHWNVPIALYEQELPRTGWADILGLCERLRPDVALVPRAPDLRVLHYGLSHELMGDGGVLWSARALAIGAGVNNEAGFAQPVASYLGARYGQLSTASARERIQQGLGAVAAQLARAHAQGHAFLLGAELTALDIYAATALTMLAPLPLEQCPDHRSGPAFRWLNTQVADILPARLLDHRDFIYREKLGLPIAF